MRICSLLPSATEILYALGLDDDIVGVSHECDYPEAARQKPQVISTTIDQNHSSSDEIDQAVRHVVAQQTSLYQIDEAVLQRARPDLIVTQELCDVCAIETAQVKQALRVLSHQPQILALHPHTLGEMLEDIRLVGEATGRQMEAKQLIGACRQRITQVQRCLRDLTVRPRVFCLEWLKPPMASGHWVPEMVELAGGLEVLGRCGEPSRYVTNEEIIAAAPEVLILMPCGFPMARTQAELSVVRAQPWWDEIPAVRHGAVYVVNGPAYFNRSGPRLIDGIELLAGILHPDQCRGTVPPGVTEVAAL